MLLDGLGYVGVVGDDGIDVMVEFEWWCCVEENGEGVVVVKGDD